MKTHSLEKHQRDGVSRVEAILKFEKDSLFNSGSRSAVAENAKSALEHRQN